MSSDLVVKNTSKYIFTIAIKIVLIKIIDVCMVSLLNMINIFPIGK